MADETPKQDTGKQAPLADDDGASGTPSAPPAGDGQHGDGEKRTFSQADIDRIVKERLNRAEAKWKADADEAAKKAQMGEAERIQHEAKQAVEAAKATADNLKARLVNAEAKAAAAALGVKAERIDYAVKLAELGAAINDEGEVDTAAVADAIKAVVADLPELVAGTTSPPARSGGDFKGDGPGDGKRVWKTSEIKALGGTPEYADHEADIMAAMREGRIIRDT